MVPGLLFTLVLLFGLGDFSVTTGKIIRTSGLRHHTCDSTMGVLFFDDYGPEVEGSFLRSLCCDSARDRTITHGLFVTLGLGAVIGGICGEPAPPVRSIHVLGQLPTPDEMRRRRR